MPEQITKSNMRPELSDTARAAAEARRDSALKRGDVLNAIRATSELKGVRPLATSDNPVPRGIDIWDLSQRGDLATSQPENPNFLRDSAYSRVSNARSVGSGVVYSLTEAGLREATFDPNNAPANSARAHQELLGLSTAVDRERARMGADLAGSYRINFEGEFTAMNANGQTIAGAGTPEAVAGYLQGSGYRPVNEDRAPSHLPDIPMQIHNHPLQSVAA